MTALSALVSYLDGLWRLAASDLKIYWVFAIFGSAVFIVQLLLTLFGFGGDHDVDVDGDGTVSFGEHADTGLGDFHLFSVRSVFAFITFFGWGGVLWGDGGLSSFFAACGSGFGMMVGTAALLFLLMRLQHSGNITAADIIGCSGNVYLRIPGGMDKEGKVTVSLKGCTREIAAVAEEEINKGVPVRVIKLIGGNRYLVEKA